MESSEVITNASCSLTHLDEDKQTSSKSSTADELSSIEVINWSDFEDEEENLKIPNSNLIPANDNQEIHSSLTNVINPEVEDNQGFDTLSVSTETVVKASEELIGSITENNINKLEFKQKQGMKRKREDSPKLSSNSSNPSSSSSGDLSSNAAVLDDGPIWSKGSKRYRFEENRQMNQKLTFGVLISVVLAMGLGLGNLVAYNECEAEHHRVVEQAACPLTKTPSFKPFIKNMEGKLSNVYPTKASLHEFNPSPTVIPKIPATALPSQLKKLKLDTERIHQHHRSDEISHVIKMLDDLSRKMDQFENSTKQLGGLVMVNNDYSFMKPTSAKSPTNNVQLLSEFLEARISRKSSRNDQIWKNRKEEMLDEIAGVVLKAMKNIFEETENEEFAKLEKFNEKIAFPKHFQKLSTQNQHSNLLMEKVQIIDSSEETQLEIEREFDEIPVTKEIDSSTEHVQKIIEQATSIGSDENLSPVNFDEAHQMKHPKKKTNSKNRKHHNSKKIKNNSKQDVRKVVQSKKKSKGKLKTNSDSDWLSARAKHREEIRTNNQNQLKGRNTNYQKNNWSNTKEKRHIFKKKKY